MPLIQVFAPKASVSERRRQEISRALLDEVIEVEGAPDTPLVRSITWVMWREIDEWWVGSAPLSGDDPPRYIVQVGVPGGAMDDAKRQAMVEGVTQVLAKSDDDPDRFTREPAAFVVVDEIPDGSWGTMGRVIRYSELVSLVKGDVGAGAGPPG